MKLKEIQSLIRFVSKSGVDEVKLEMKDIKINIRNTPREKTVVQSVQTTPTVTQAVTAAPTTETTATETPSSEEHNNYIEITSPIIGTFYRKPSPDKPVFASVGDVVEADTVVCIVEAMKLFNEIESEVSGKIVKALVEDGTPVEFGQPLFLVDPS
jgi:acetyl-CoA carboxylase biotin carboxyl carrier protein